MSDVYEIEARRTIFPARNGEDRIFFRSLLEARWALTFDMMDIKWSYEPFSFELNSRLVYTPDFYLEDIGWIEIKPTFKTLLAVKEKLLAFTLEKDEVIPLECKTNFYSLTAPFPCFFYAGERNSTLVEHRVDGYEVGNKEWALDVICAPSQRSYKEYWPGLYKDKVDDICGYTKDVYFGGPHAINDLLALTINDMAEKYTRERRNLRLHSSSPKL